MLTSWKHHACVSADHRREARVWWENPVCHVFLRVFDIFDTERDRPIRKTLVSSVLNFHGEQVIFFFWLKEKDFYRNKTFFFNSHFLCFFLVCLMQVVLCVNFVVFQQVFFLLFLLLLLLAFSYLILLIHKYTFSTRCVHPSVGPKQGKKQ